MAGDHGYEPGAMDISQHRKTWALFTKITAWSLGSIGVLMLLLLIFRTHG
jgi:hypothetical protein